jgi:hypothetical protein
LTEWDSDFTFRDSGSRALARRGATSQAQASPASPAGRRRHSDTLQPNWLLKINLILPTPGHGPILEAFGTDDADFVDGVIKQLVNAGTQGRVPDECAANFMLSMVKGIKPQDSVETMLAAQMAAIHNATMTFARRLAHVDNIKQQDSAQNALNKLARTFAAQVAALKNYRSKGEQRVLVEHVHVHAGGQAIVGNIKHEGGGGERDRLALEVLGN